MTGEEKIGKIKEKVESAAIREKSLFSRPSAYTTRVRPSRRYPTTELKFMKNQVWFVGGWK